MLFYEVITPDKLQKLNVIARQILPEPSSYSDLSAVIALNDSELVGILTFELDEGKSNRCSICDYVVKEKYRGLGIGNGMYATLLDFLETVDDKWTVDMILPAEDEEAEGFLESLGMAFDENAGYMFRLSIKEFLESPLQKMLKDNKGGSVFDLEDYLETPNLQLFLSTTPLPPFIRRTMNDSDKHLSKVMNSEDKVTCILLISGNLGGQSSRNRTDTFEVSYLHISSGNHLDMVRLLNEAARTCSNEYSQAGVFEGYINEKTAKQLKGGLIPDLRTYSLIRYFADIEFDSEREE